MGGCILLRQCTLLTRPSVLHPAACVWDPHDGSLVPVTIADFRNGSSHQHSTSSTFHIHQGILVGKAHVTVQLLPHAPSYMRLEDLPPSSPLASSVRASRSLLRIPNGQRKLNRGLLAATTKQEHQTAPKISRQEVEH